jgi:hypothetical protein
VARAEKTNDENQYPADTLRVARRRKCKCRAEQRKRLSEGNMLCMRRGCARLEESLLSSRQGSSGYEKRNCGHGEENMEGFTRKKMSGVPKILCSY